LKKTNSKKSVIKKDDFKNLSIKEFDLMMKKILSASLEVKKKKSK
jgi:hypothetical protein